MATSNNTTCLCEKCGIDLKKDRFKQIHVHLNIDTFSYPNLYEHVKYLKSKNKLTSTFLASIGFFKKYSSLDFGSLNKSLDRVESIISVSSDKAALLSISKEIDYLRDQINR